MAFVLTSAGIRIFPPEILPLINVKTNFRMKNNCVTQKKLTNPEMKRRGVTGVCFPRCPTENGF
jgi:hypothetical protein